MWQFDLLARVVPAFGALAKQFLEGDCHDARLMRDAEDCYNDIVLIGQAIYMSAGEWAPGLDELDLTKLLTAFESRFPTKWRVLPSLSGIYSWKSQTEVHIGGDSSQFVQLRTFARECGSAGCGGYQQCFEILSHQSPHAQYIKLLGEDVSLFRKSERRDADKRDKFLKRVRRAREHLLDVYYRDDAGDDAVDVSLSQHPSHGMKEDADKVCNYLARHWRCKCPEREDGPREARLSLIRYRQLVQKLVSSQKNSPAKFEVLLPMCKKSVEWKVTNVEVKKVRSLFDTRESPMAVKHDVCYHLRHTSEMAQVDFLIENEGFWHRRPQLVDGINHYTSMESLDQFLGDELDRSYISHCNPREQLILCYVLANAMLYLYPNSWFSTQWDRNTVYFVRRPNQSRSPALGFPYLAVNLQTHQTPKNEPHPLQTHIHPAILSLGIVFLEVATGTRFNRSQNQSLWEQCNENHARAKRSFNDLKRRQRQRRTKQIPSSLMKAIGECLQLHTPSTAANNNLQEEGPIRHYILSCIVKPLANELENGYGVLLEDLQRSLIPEMQADLEDFDDTQSLLSHRSTASVSKSIHSNTNVSTFPVVINARKDQATEPTQLYAEHVQSYLYRDRGEECVPQCAILAEADDEHVDGDDGRGSERDYPRAAPSGDQG